MIFLVGARRSGTNWLQRVVGAHAHVAVVPSETYLFSRGIKPLRERFHHGVLGSPATGAVHMDRDRLLDGLRDLCDGVFLPFLEAASGAKRVAERTPEHATCLALIGEVYPDAHVVHITRDGRDVVRSLLAQTWETAPRSVAEAAEEWRSCVDAAEDAGNDLRRYRRIRYEDMLADPRRVVTELYEWLGLDTTASILEEALLEAEVPFNVDATAPSIKVGKWRETFSAEDVSTFMRIAGPSLKRLGYDADATPGRPDGPPSQPVRDRSERSNGEPERPRGRLLSRSRRSRLGRRAAGGEGPSGVNNLLIDSERILGRVVASFTTGRRQDLEALLGTSLWVRVVAGSDEWSGRGAGARDRLADVVSADDALRGRQTAGDVHVGIPTSVALMRFVGPTGSVHVRMVAVTIQDGQVARITYYQIQSANA